MTTGILYQLPRRGKTLLDNVLEHPDLALAYNETRKCMIMHSDGRTEELTDAYRMTLGFEKMREMVRIAKITSDDVVLAMFGGPGGSVRMLSVLNPRILIAADILYPGLNPTPTGWRYCLEAPFNNWVRLLVSYGITCSGQVRHPVNVQLDVTGPAPAMTNSVDVVFIDSPYGKVSERILGITADGGKTTFLSALRLAQQCLRHGGRIICGGIPNDWIDEHLLYDDGLQICHREEVPSKQRFVVTELQKMTFPIPC